jgi:hypothetical protein
MVEIMAVKQIYMVIGCPGSGKSWVCQQLVTQYAYVAHDSFIGENYVNAIKRYAEHADKPLLIETPFSISQVKEPLETAGFNVTPLFIQEHNDVIRKRYREREGKDIPPGHLARQLTYEQRAVAWHAFQGTSEQVLDRLKQLVPVGKKFPWE